MTHEEYEDQDIEPPGARRQRLYPEVSDRDWNDWRWQYRNRLTTAEEIDALGWSTGAEPDALRLVMQHFRVAVTPYYLTLLDPTNPEDPIARQALPTVEEYVYRDVGEDDPLHEERTSPVPGLTHRYPDRALLLVSNNCAMYCRHCTRKRLLAEGAVPQHDLARMIDYVARHREIRDVVVSGGDPLTLSTPRLERILRQLRAISHVEVIRIGTRIPCVLPQRVDAELCRMLRRYHPLWMNVHFEHPREITPEATAACSRLAAAGIPLGNQSVLLRGINDDPLVMRDLLHGLLRMRVRPYYLYQCDPVRGVEHLRTTVARGIELIQQLRGHTSGLAIPNFVVDAPGGGGKIPVGPEYLQSYDEASGHARLRNYQGQLFHHHDPARSEPTTQAPFPNLVTPLVASWASSCDYPLSSTGSGE